jgi:putative oxidoreductase
MNIVTTIARIILGLGFTVAGASAFFIGTPPPEPGLAGAFNDLFFRSHWVYFISVAQIALGLLLLVNRFVPVALIMLAAFLYNSFAFHITMAQSGLPAPAIVFVLWLTVSLKYRALFAPVFAANPPVTQRNEDARRATLTGYAA